MEIEHSANDRPLLLWFGGRGGSTLSAKVLGDWGVELWAFPEEKPDWFTGGIPGVADGWEASVAALRARLGQRRFVIGGTSAGGYAALRASLDLQPDLCLAYSPQTGAVDHSVELPDLTPLYRIRPPSFPVTIHLSRSEADNPDGTTWGDHEQIAGFWSAPGVEIVTHPYDQHATVFMLHCDGGKFYPQIAAEVLTALADPGPVEAFGDSARSRAG